jgi:sugar transferase (PEP-CTERM/EpsH1 system associated)
MRILFLTGRLPYPPNRGDRLRAYHFLRVLSQQHQITLLSFIGDNRETGHIGPLRPFCEDIQLVHRGQFQSTMTTGLNAWRRIPFQSLYYRSSVMQGAVDRLLDRQQFDAVYVHLFRMAQFVANRSNPYRILDLTDAISSEVERSLPYRDAKWRMIYRLELPRIRRYERDIVRHFDETWLISNAEREELLDGKQNGKVRIVPNGVDTARYRPSGLPTDAPTLIFVGHMGVFHNVDAAEFLVRDILPRVRASFSSTRLDLVGAEPAPQVLQLASKSGVRVLGHVADLNAALNDASIFVAPLRFAAGVQNKVLEAMAVGLPVVTTTYVNNGLEAEDGRHLLVADEPEQFADSVITLLKDAQLRRKIGRAGREFVMKQYRWEDVLDRVNAIEMEVIRARQR